MSYVIKIVVPPVPGSNRDAYGFADNLLRDSAGTAPSPRLRQFCDALSERFPCPSTGVYGDGVDGNVCPWGDAKLMHCFTGDIGVINIVARNVEVIPFLLRRAGTLALTVIDEQADRVHRPATFSVTLGAIQKHVDRQAMISKLVPLLKRTPEEVSQLLDTPHAVLKRRLDHVTAQRFAKTLDLVGCDCTIEKEMADAGITIPISGPGAAGLPVPPVVPYDTIKATATATEEDEVPSSWVARVISKVAGRRK